METMLFVSNSDKLQLPEGISGRQTCKGSAKAPDPRQPKRGRAILPTRIRTCCSSLSCPASLLNRHTRCNRSLRREVKDIIWNVVLFPCNGSGAIPSSLFTIHRASPTWPVPMAGQARCSCPGNRTEAAIRFGIYLRSQAQWTSRRRKDSPARCG